MLLPTKHHLLLLRKMVLDASQQAFHVHMLLWLLRQLLVLRLVELLGVVWESRIGRVLWLLWLILLLHTRCFDQLFGHHDVFGHERFLMLALLLLQVVEENFSQVRLASFLKRFEQEVLVIHHELLQLLLVEPLVLELALVDFAHASAVQVLAGEEAEVV